MIPPLTNEFVLLIMGTSLVSCSVSWPPNRPGVLREAATQETFSGTPFVAVHRGAWFVTLPSAAVSRHLQRHGATSRRQQHQHQQLVGPVHGTTRRPTRTCNDQVWDNDLTDTDPAVPFDELAWPGTSVSSKINMDPRLHRKIVCVVGPSGYGQVDRPALREPPRPSGGTMLIDGVDISPTDCDIELDPRAASAWCSSSSTCSRTCPCWQNITWGRRKVRGQLERGP